MGDELQVPAATLAEIRTVLARGREALEGSAPSAPGGIDAGEMSALLTGMMSKVVDRAAAVSDSLAAVSAQVGEAGSGFWETDAEVASTYDAPGVPR